MLSLSYEDTIKFKTRAEKIDHFAEKKYYHLVSLFTLLELVELSKLDENTAELVIQSIGELGKLITNSLLWDINELVDIAKKGGQQNAK